jgi:hypothetical protein
MDPQWALCNGSVYFDPLKALYFRNIYRMGIRKNPLIRLLIVYNKL